MINKYKILLITISVLWGMAFFSTKILPMKQMEEVQHIKACLADEFRCPICYVTDDKPTITLHDNHIFHRECAIRSLGYDLACPLCRMPVDLRSDSLGLSDQLIAQIESELVKHASERLARLAEEDQDVVQQLVDGDGISITDIANDSLVGFAEIGNEEYIKIFLRDNPHITQRGVIMALIAAVEGGDANLVKILLVDPRINRFNIYIPLSISVEIGYADIVKIFLADPRITFLDIDLCLEIAIGKRYADIVEILINDLRFNKFDLKWALKKAVQNNDVDIVQLFINDSKISPSDIKDALEISCKGGCTAIVQLLINDPRISPFDQRAALTIALEMGYTDIVYIIQEECRHCIIL